MSASDPHRMPRPPREPDPTDCCGSGCDPCIFELYQERLERWRERCQALRRETTDS
jgi:cytochrome-b5 reductase